MVKISLVKIFEETVFHDKLIKIISPERKSKILKYRNIDDKKRSLLTELLIRKTASEQLMRPYEHLTIAYNPYGKPYISNDLNFCFNVSHSMNYVVIAVSCQGIGIDIEHIKNIDIGVAKRFFSAAEYEKIKNIISEKERLEEFYRIWTLKESYVKKIGRGMLIPFDSFGFDNENSLIIYDKHIPDHKFFSTVFEGYAMSVCYSEKHFDYAYKFINDQELYDFYL